MANHTPGPWMLQSLENELRYIVTDSRTESHVIAGPYSVQLPMVKGEDNSVTLANARLMAAAPELVEALKAVDDDLKSYWLSDATKAKIDAALRKVGV